MFLIKWMGYPVSEATWEYEDSLQGAYSIVSTYRTKANLSPTKLVPLAGANKLQRARIFNKENWVSLDQMKAVLNQFRRHPRYCAGLDALFIAAPIAR